MAIPRCRRCGKEIFRDRIAAEMNLIFGKRRNTRKDRPMRAYYDKKCRKWHTTGKPKRGESVD